MTEIWGDDAWRLADIPWEGIIEQNGIFIAVFLANNQYGIVFVIPDSDYLPHELRHCIEQNLDSLLIAL